MDFIPQPIEQYAELHSTAEPARLVELTRITHLKTTMPRMLSGHLQGRFLSFVSHWLKPKLVFEVGTFTGYASLCMAEGLQESGMLITCDVDEEVVEIARSFFEKSPYKAQIESRIGDARDELAKIKQPIDLAFIDGDKIQYTEYYEALVPHLRTGGVIVADNVLWSGKVVDKSCTDSETEAIRTFNNFVSSDDRVESVLLPLRDGLRLIRKK